MKRLYLLLAIVALGVAACNDETSQQVTPPAEEKEVDARLKFMDDACAMGVEVDDHLFLWHLENKVFYYGNDSKGTASGCSYGDIGMYVSEDGELTHKYMAEAMYLYNHRALMMFENNVCRVNGYWGDRPFHVEGNRFPEYDYHEKGFRNRYWRYDAETNMLYTKMWNVDDLTSDEIAQIEECSAEVLYVDHNVAILKGHIMEEPLKEYADWGYFYVDFRKYDREAYTSEYDKDFTFYPDQE